LENYLRLIASTPPISRPAACGQPNTSRSEIFNFTNSAAVCFSQDVPLTRKEAIDYASSQAERAAKMARLFKVGL
jgi:hypothetical protein